VYFHVLRKGAHRTHVGHRGEANIAEIAEFVRLPRTLISHGGVVGLSFWREDRFVRSLVAKRFEILDFLITPSRVPPGKYRNANACAVATDEDGRTCDNAILGFIGRLGFAAE
jgi:hypothetical protein